MTLRFYYAVAVTPWPTARENHCSRIRSFGSNSSLKKFHYTVTIKKNSETTFSELMCIFTGINCCALIFNIRESFSRLADVAYMYDACRIVSWRYCALLTGGYLLEPSTHVTVTSGSGCAKNTSERRTFRRSDSS